MGPNGLIGAPSSDLRNQYVCLRKSRRYNIIIVSNRHFCGNCHIGTPKIYTTTGFGPRKNREMAGVDDLVVYTQTAVKYNTFYIHHPGGAKRPRLLYFKAVCIYTTKSSTPAISLFFLGPQPGGGVYLWGPKNMIKITDVCGTAYGFL